MILGNQLRKLFSFSIFGVNSEVDGFKPEITSVDARIAGNQSGCVFYH